jgi:DNA-binding NarL/FixJ family response regulator
MKKIKIAIADDHKIVRQGYCALFNTENSVKLVFDVENGREVLNQLEKNEIDVLLLDIDMPVLNGKQTLNILNIKYPDVKVIMLSMYFDDFHIAEFVTNGARGFLAKNTDFDDVIDAIHSVSDQGYYFNNKISKVLLTKLIHSKKINPIFSLDPLTVNEIEVLRLICNEKTNIEIGHILNKSKKTIDGYRSRIALKTNARNTAGMVIYAIKHGIFQVL